MGRPRLIESLTRVCKEHPVDRKVLLVRNHHAGQLILHSLARCGGGWLNLRAMTPAGLAAEGLTAADDLALEAIVIDAYESIKRSFFPDRPPLGLIAAIQRAISELRIAGVTPEQLRELKSPKARELAAMLDRYTAALRRDGLLDEAELYRMASGKSSPQTTLLLPQHLKTIGLCRAFVASYRAGRVITLEEDPVEGVPSVPIDIFAAVGARNEIREVFRRIVERRIPFEEVEIILPDYATRSVLLADVAAEVGGIQLTFGSGQPGLRSGPARTLFSFAQWVENDFPEPVLRGMFAGGGIKPPEGLSGRQAARLLRSAQIGWGRDRYVERLEAIKAESMAFYVGEVLELVEENDFVTAAADFLEKYAVVRSEAEAGVLKRLVRRLRSSKSGADAPHSKAIATSVTVDASAPAPGHIHVVPLAAAGLSWRKNVFILGLSEAAFPGTLANDPILTDEERGSLSPDLTVSAEVMRERAFQFGQALSRVRGNLYLSYSTAELSDGSRIFPSPLLLQAHRVASGNADADYEDLAKALGPPSGFIPGKLPLGTDEWWLSKMGDGGILKDARDIVLAAHPDLKAGRNGIAAMQDPISGEHDGRLSRDPDFDPRESRRPVSVTALENYASCPRQFLFRNLLGIELPQEVALEPGRWLDPLQRGSLLHEFYSRFLAQLKAAKQRRDPDKHRRLADSLLDEVIAEWHKQVPPPSEVVFESERSVLHRSLGVFLREETHVPSPGPGIPEHFELSFGLPDDDGGGTPDPVEIALPGGRSILLRGRIDRIDRLAQPGTWAVWDYKTGRARGYSENQYTAGGTQLQHVLYACAAEQILRRLGEKNPKVVVSGYLFPTERSDGNICVPRDARRRGDGLAVLSDLLDAMASGIFLGTGENCQYCDWGAACREDEKARWDFLTGAHDGPAAVLEAIHEQE
jgi:hypothetical protein